ncbi:exosortase U [Alienimonas californiensis]|uniref:Transmembrane exosortase (Exosortase_EpsH) n=1 Tax=Alienimonas californiensis TaxID=2527989 RepID=A0A517PFU2_9PLAN|nr:exosortase U [Alienimonas californiensis]QDT18231.1 Transmembrane exosortase (Exosortase_EpsH) [Alienimonas californiensis]
MPTFPAPASVRLAGSVIAVRPARRPRGATFAAGAAALAGLLALGPLLAEIVVRLWTSPRFEHAPLIWLAAAALGGWRLRESLVARQEEPVELGEPAASPRPWAEAVLWLLALLPTTAAILLGSGWLALTAAFLVVPAATYSAGGGATLRPILPAWAVLWTTLPPPFHTDADLVLRLQGLAAKLASAALDMLGRRHLPAGVTVELPGRSYFVEEACSGVNSLYALLAVAALGLAWGRRSWWRWLIVLPAAVGWAVAANAARVTAAVELSAGLGWPVAEGFGHDLLGMLTFAAAGLLTLSVDALLRFAVPPAEAVPAELDEPNAPLAPSADPPPPPLAAEPATERRPVPRAAAWGAAAVAFGLLAGWRLAVGPAVDVAAVPASTLLTPAALKPVGEDSLPAEWNGWRRGEFRTVTRDRDHLDGPFSAQWVYRRGPLEATISMDGPFAEGWHDLRTCYTAGGWACTDAVDRVVTSAEEEEGGSEADGDVITRLDLAQPLGRRGVVFFTSYAVDDDANLGADLAARTGSSWTRRFEAFRDRSAPDAGHAAAEPAYQVQVLASGYRTLSDEEKEAVEALFHAMRRRLAALPRDAAPPRESASRRTAAD